MATGASKVSRRDHAEVGGVVEYEQPTDSAYPWSWDWAGEISSPTDPIASVAYVDSGVTRSGTALAAGVRTGVNTVTSALITGTGDIEVTCTTTAGQVMVRTFAFVAPDGSAAAVEDYP